MSKEDHLVELPEFSEIKELLASTKKEITDEVKADKDLAEPSKLLLKVIQIIEEKIKTGNTAKLNDNERIDLAAHLNFLQMLMEDFFFDEDFDDFDDFDDEDFDEDELELEEEEEEKPHRK